MHASHPPDHSKTLQESAARHVDVLIVGGGMVGAAAAIGFARMGMKTCVLDAADINQKGETYSPSFDERSTALSFGSRRILEKLGVWTSLSSHACPIANIHVSEKARLGVTRMAAADYQLDALGYVTPNQAIGESLLSQFEELGIELICPVELSDIQAVPEGYRVSLASRSELFEARLLIIADGARSKTASRLSIDYDVQPYGQHALIANVETALTHNNVAYERFTVDGPLALLPLEGNRAALVWTLSDEKIDSIKELSDREFLQALEAQFGGRFGGFVRVGDRFSYPLTLSRAKEQYRPGLMLLGNAAHSLHPVAGQGFNLALRGVAALLEATLQEGLDCLGHPSVLAKACQSHEQDKLLTINASDRLVKGFSSDAFWLGLSRDLGLVGLNNLPVLKRIFAEQAMGLGGKQYQFRSAGKESNL